MILTDVEPVATETPVIVSVAVLSCALTNTARARFGFGASTITYGVVPPPTDTVCEVPFATTTEEGFALNIPPDCDGGGVA
jgi:hypothetical protein